MGKNWPEICKIDNHSLRLALSQIDAKQDLGIRLTTAFPECFTEGEDRGPVPLSSIVRKMHELCHPSELMIDDALKAMKVPFVRWSCTEGNYGEYFPKFTIGLLSDEFQEENDMNFGSTITIDGSEFVIVTEPCEEVALVPAELILVDTRNFGPEHS